MGVGGLLAAHFDLDEMQILPAPSAFWEGSSVRTTRNSALFANSFSSASHTEDASHEGWFDIDGIPMDEPTWTARSGEWLPTDEDRAYVKSLMTPVYEPGKMANWIAPPRRGINGLPLEYEYVRV